MNRSYRFHSRWKAMKLYPRGTNLRRDTKLKLIMSDMSLRVKVDVLLQFHEAIDSYCKMVMQSVMSLVVDTTNLLKDRPVIAFPSAGGEKNDIPEDARGFIEFVEQEYSALEREVFPRR